MGQLGERIKELREARRWNQRQLGERVALTAARISQIEKADTAPPDDVLLTLAAVLGDDVLRAAGWGHYAERRPIEADACVALWRIRVDVLRDDGVVGSNEEAANRARELAAELERVACTAPEASIHVRNDALDSLARIVADLPRTAVMVLAAEALDMMIDAPVHLLKRQDDANSRVYAKVARLILEAKGVDARQARDIFEARSDRPRGRWTWKRGERPPCAGGAYGQLWALCSGDPSVLLLKGDEPTGWFGWSMAAGLWQVRTQDALTAGLGAGDDDLRDLSGTAIRLGAALARIDGPGITRLPTLSPAAAAFARLHHSAPASLGGDVSRGWLTAAPEDLHPQLLTARSLGWLWVRAHANRLVALYNGFPEIAEHGDSESGIPSRDEARLIIVRLADAATRIYRREAGLSGASKVKDKFPFNEGLRDWADLADTWRVTAKLLN